MIFKCWWVWKCTKPHLGYKNIKLICIYISLESLQRYFNRYGEVIDCVVMKNSESGRSRGFGFVTFADPNNVNVVLQNGPHVLDGRTVSDNIVVNFINNFFERFVNYEIFYFYRSTQNHVILELCKNQREVQAILRFFWVVCPLMLLKLI